MFVPDDDDADAGRCRVDFHHWKLSLQNILHLKGTITLINQHKQ